MSNTITVVALIKGLMDVAGIIERAIERGDKTVDTSELPGIFQHQVVDANEEWENADQTEHGGGE